MKILKICLMFLMVIVLVGCDCCQKPDPTPTEEDPRNNPKIVESKYYGKWMYIHSGEEIDIISTTELDYTELDSNLIRITEADGSSTHIMRASIANTKVSGKLKKLTTTSRSYGGVGGMNVVLQNVLDPKIKAEVKTNDDGTFEDSSLPSGTYSVNAQDGDESFNMNFDLEEEVEDLGNMSLAENGTHNFKTELLLDKEFVYADGNEYTGKIRVHNISNEIGLGLNYDIVLEDKFKKSFSETIVLGSVESKGYRDIPIRFSFNPIYDNYRKIDVNVTINDANSNSWFDSFSFLLYKRSFDINVATAQANIKGYIVMPNTKEIKQVDIGNGKITLPVLLNKKYHLVFSNPSISNETAYSLGIESSTKSFEGYKDTSIHENNDIASQAKTLSLGDSVISYLEKSDIDYWLIEMKNTGTLASSHAKEREFGSVGTRVNQTLTATPIQISSIAPNTTKQAIIDKGSIVLNGVDTGEKNITIKNGDRVSIKLKSASTLKTNITSTLIFGNIIRKYSVTTYDYIVDEIHTVDSNIQQPESVFVSKIDDDGNVDIVVGSDISNGIFWYENDGFGNPVEFAKTSLSAYADNKVRTVYPIDLDSDGDVDIISCDYEGDVAWLSNDGNQNFDPYEIHRSVLGENDRITDKGARRIQALDIDEDGDIDILIAFDSKIVLYRNDGNENFTDKTIATSDTQIISVYAKDIDSDNDTDLVVSNGSVQWFKNDGNENFTKFLVSNETKYSEDAMALDIDKDGDIDIVAGAKGTRGLDWYENDGNENFTTHALKGDKVIDDIYSIDAGDFDGDGDIDLIGSDWVWGRIVWYENNGSQNFIQHLITEYDFGRIKSIQAVDMDHDGYLEVILASELENTIRWLDFGFKSVH
ncbi:MAG: FG-GAP-like repeat-containing protein [Campylobacterales bacterium]|nr:FG-GAP-like repeat-containing protein [Campylobacterales bacterium]